MIYHYYFPLVLSADVNYLFLFRLFQLAEYDYQKRRFVCVRFSSLKELSARLNVSYDTLNRERKRKDNELFFRFDTKGKFIVLNTDFRTRKLPFILLTNKEVSFLLEQNNNFLCKYFIYLKYYCSKCENSFTQEQFLSTIGYCSNSGKNKEQLAFFNRLLVEKGFICLRTEFSQEEKKIRNFFRFVVCQTKFEEQQTLSKFVF